MTNLVLRATARVRRDDGTSLVPCWIPPAFLAAAAVLIPWIGLLFATLPRHYGANHWQLAWAGFDIALGLALATTAVAAMRQSAFSEVAATVTGTLLVCDAWLRRADVTRDGRRRSGVVLAVFVELPIAVLCFWIARNVARAVETARPFLQAAGFTIRDHKLVPPAGLVKPGR